MFGTLVNVAAILSGTTLGCLLKHGLSQRYEQALFDAMGLTALGIGVQYIATNLPHSHYPVLFIVSLALGAVSGTALQIDERFNRVVAHFGAARVGRGIATGLLLYCIGALSIVGPVMAAIKGDQTMLLTNASLDFVTSIVFGASFGWGMLVCASVLFLWQGGIFLIARYLSASFFSGALVTELAAVGGFLILASGLSILKIKAIKTLNLLPALLIPILFFIGQMLLK